MHIELTSAMILTINISTLLPPKLFERQKRREDDHVKSLSLSFDETNLLDRSLLTF